LRRLQLGQDTAGGGVPYLEVGGTAEIYQERRLAAARTCGLWCGDGNGRAVAGQARDGDGGADRQDDGRRCGERG
jgi:hypothetical protein